MSDKHLIRAFRRWRKASTPLALATVVETDGSTYTKPGHRILIAEDGTFQGLISGGCLEADLAEHARSVIASGPAQLVDYEMRGEGEELFGLGVGCDGMFRVLLQFLDPAHAYQPFAALAACMLGHERSATATVLESNSGEVAAGATLVVGGKETFAWQLPDQIREQIRRPCWDVLDGAPAKVRTHDDSRIRLKVLYAPLAPLPRLLVLGAGIDAVPVVEIADRLGWRVTVLDHRPAYLERGDLRRAERARRVDPERLAAKVKLERFNAAVVMSHHLATDRTYLAQLAGSSIPYIGLIGPAGRRDRLLADLGATARQLHGRLHAPAGVAIGADSPESIAVAILAEMHAESQKPSSPRKPA